MTHSKVSEEVTHDVFFGENFKRLKKLFMKSEKEPLENYKMDSDGIKKLILDKMFNGDLCGPFEYTDLREVSNYISGKIHEIKCNVWDEAWKAFLKNKPKNPYRKMKSEKQDVGIGEEKIKEEILQRSFDQVGKKIGNTTQVQFCYPAIFDAMEEYASVKQSKKIIELKAFKLQESTSLQYNEQKQDGKQDN